MSLERTAYFFSLWYGMLAFLNTDHFKKTGFKVIKYFHTNSNNFISFFFIN